MSPHTYRQIIMEGIKGLPQENLAEIAAFIYFVRKKALHPHDFEEEMKNMLIATELQKLDAVEVDHLEKEFQGYDRLYCLE